MTTMPTNTPPAPGLTPLQILRSVLWRHKAKVILLPTVIMTLAVLVILYYPRTYHSEARLFLRIGRETIGLDPTATTGQVIGLQQQGQESEVLSAIDLLGSKGVLGRVVDNLGPEYILEGGPADNEGGGRPSSPAFEAITNAVGGVLKTLKSIDPVSDREKAIIACQDSLKLDSEKNSSVIIVRFETETPLGAQEITQQIINVYQQEHLRIHRNRQSKDFFEEQRNRFREELAKNQEKLRDTKNEMGIASLEARRSALEDRLQAIELERYNTEQSLATAVARAEAIEGQIENTPERLLASKRLVPNVGADTLRDRFYELQLREMELKSKYSDKHPLVLAATAQLAEAESVVEEQEQQREETTDDVNPIFRELSMTYSKQKHEISGLQARAEMLDTQQTQVSAELEKMNSFEFKIRDLEREVAIATSKLMRYEDDFEQARIDRELENNAISSVAVAQEPTYNQKPVSPSKMLVVLGAMFASVGLTGGWIVAKEQLNKPMEPNAPLVPPSQPMAPAESSEAAAVYARVPREPALSSNGPE